MDKYASVRGTGRTTKMLKEALAEALKGKTVAVVGWRDIQCRCLLDQFIDLPEVRKLPVLLNFTRREVSWDRCRVLFRAASQHKFDFRTKRFPDTDPTTPVFIDHHTWEMYYEEEVQHAHNAREAAKMADARKRPESRQRHWKDSPDAPLFPRPVVGDAPMADERAPVPVSCDLPADAPSSSGGSEGPSGPCGTD